MGRLGLHDQVQTLRQLGNVDVTLFVHVLLGGNSGHSGQILYQLVSQRAVGKIAQHDIAACKIAGIVKVQVAVGALDRGHLIQGQLAAAQGRIVVGVIQADVERAQTPQHNVGTGGKRRQGAAYHKAHSQQHSRQTMTQINAFHVLHLLFSWVCVWKSAYRSARSAAWAAP